MACDESIARLFKFCSHLFGRVAELSCRPLRRINLEIDYRDPSVGPQQLSQLAKVCVFSCVDAPYPPLWWYSIRGCPLLFSERHIFSQKRLFLD